HTVLARALAHRLGESGEAGVGGGAADVLERMALARHADDVDDDAALARLHARIELARQVDEAEDLELPRVAPFRLVERLERAGPANAKHGSRFLVRGGNKTTLEGDIPFERIVVSEFPDVETAKRFYNSPEYQEARKHRLGAADFHMVIVEGAQS